MADNIQKQEREEDDGKDDEKEDEQFEKDNELNDMPVFERIAKPHPGEHFKDKYPDKVDPRGL